MNYFPYPFIILFCIFKILFFYLFILFFDNNKIFEILAPTQKHFQKLNTFISMKMPSAGFPVKVGMSKGDKRRGRRWEGKEVRRRRGGEGGKRDGSGDPAAGERTEGETVPAQRPSPSTKEEGEEEIG
jgi:hypothetical protein